MTWPRTLEQEPINIGDRDYDPLFPYGLRADRPLARWWGPRPRLVWEGARTGTLLPPPTQAVHGCRGWGWRLAAVAMVLTIAVVVLLGARTRPSPTHRDLAPGRRPPPPRYHPTRPPGRAGGARVEGRPARPGVAAGFTAVGAGDQGIALAELLRCAKGHTPSGQPAGRCWSWPPARLAADTLGEVTHDAHLPGAPSPEVVPPPARPGDRGATD